MSATRFAKVKAILADAYDLPKGERTKYLRTACGDDAELLAEVRSLLAVDERDGETLLEGPEGRGKMLGALRRGLADQAASLEPGPLPEDIAGYRVVRLIARGGMGAVYEAQQLDPKRRVALKMLRTELTGSETLRRFRREVQILARLQHEGIAQVYDAGVTQMADQVEQPYFVMEYVDGRPITAFVADGSLDLDERLKLMARVCDAVAHAHDKGVVHRDLKPDNILVTDAGRPKVLDFGVALSTTSDADLTSSQTQAGQILGTLAYMSPEQVRGDPKRIDHRADVYALGVVLYELLSGERPFDVAGRSFSAALEMIQRHEARRLGQLDPRLRGDLETIVGKALEKEPARRYDSAGALANELRAVLTHQPIQARPPSAIYQARKFARRHRGLVTGSLIGVSALLIGLVVAVQAGMDQARQRAASEMITYQTVLESAATQLSFGEPRVATIGLERAPERLRGWEWEHLRARLDDAAWSAAVDVPHPRDEVLDLPRSFPAWFTSQAVAFSENGARVVSMIDARSIGVWESATGRLLARHEPGPELYGPALALAGTRVAVGTRDDRLLVLDIDSGALIEEQALPGRAQGLAWHPDGGRLAVCVQLPDLPLEGLAEPIDRLHHVVLVGRPEALRPLEEAVGNVRPPIWLADGDWLVVPRDSGNSEYMEHYKLHVLDAETGELLQNFGDLPRTASIAGRVSGRELFMGTVSRKMERYADATVDAPGRMDTGHRATFLGALAVAEERDLAVTVAGDELRVWAASDQARLRVHELGSAPWPSVAVDRAGRYAAVAQQDRLRVWDLEATPARELRDDGLAIYWMALTPDGRTLITFDFDASTHVWDVHTGELLARIPPPDAVLERPWHLAYTRVGLDADAERWFWIRGKQFRALDLVTGQVFERVDGAPEPAPDAEPTLIVEPAYLAARDTHLGRGVSTQVLITSPDGKRLLNVREATLHDADGEGEVTPLKMQRPDRDAFDEMQRDGCFSPDGRHLALASEDELVRIFDARTGKLERELSGVHRGQVYSVAWSPDGARLASGDELGALIVWDTQTWLPMTTLQDTGAYVHDLLWTPDGTTLISASGDGVARLWDSLPRAELNARARAARDAVEAQRSHVMALFAVWNTPEAVVTALRDDPALDVESLHAALRVVREVTSAQAGR